ncbi:MAG: inositol monophosphatase family protein [Planctomycetaceae bacterium]|nr:inositol monophosphatase [Planctomycetaceae bacterium]MDG2388985.1 inositol monophosphatase family protein [Planctomycetaceae bacterium]
MSDPKLQQIVDALGQHMPDALRWSGAVAKQLRYHSISIEGKKESGSPMTDALTLADLTVQELLIAAIRDADPILHECRIEAEETTGDLGRFPEESPYTICLDPIDGTKQYRDKTGNGYAVMLSLRTVDTLHYSLVYIPETGDQGTWVEVSGETIRCGADNWSVPARQRLDAMTLITTENRPDSDKIYMIGFQDADTELAAGLSEIGLQGFTADTMPGCIFALFATGEFGGSLIHSPNVYDFPVSLQIARILGGDALWVHSGEPVHFEELWLDDRADMLRLPGVVACSHDPEKLKKMCEHAKDWNPVRYQD